MTRMGASVRRGYMHCNGVLAELLLGKMITREYLRAKTNSRNS